MSRSTISTFKLFEMFPDEETARVYLESRLWPKGVSCPTCAGRDRITPRKAGFRRCNKVDSLNFVKKKMRKICGRGN
jgi:hypothetical protein